MKDYVKYIRENLSCRRLTDEEIEIHRALKEQEPEKPYGYCECCGRHINEIESCNGSDSSLDNEENRARLYSKERPYIPYEEQIEYIVSHAFYVYREAGFEYVNYYALHKYGKEGDDLVRRDQLAGSYGSSHECINCINLDHDEYFKKKAEARKKFAAKIDN